MLSNPLFAVSGFFIPILSFIAYIVIQARKITDADIFIISFASIIYNFKFISVT